MKNIQKINGFFFSSELTANKLIQFKSLLINVCVEMFAHNTMKSEKKIGKRD